MVVVAAASPSVEEPAGRVEDGTGAADSTEEGNTAQTTPEVNIETSSSRPGTSSSSAAAESPTRSAAAAAPQRNTSSKFANLRAAFEKKGASANGSPDAVGRKRMASSSDLTVDKTRDRIREHEAEIARLKDELDKERELRVAYEDKVGSLEENIESMNEKASKQAEELKAAVDKIHELEQLEEARAVDEEGSQTDDEAGATQDTAALRRQLSDLKRSISRSTRPSNQLADSTLRQEIGLLQYEAQNWVVNHFRKAKPEASSHELCDRLTRIAEPEQVSSLRPLYESFDAGSKLAIYQSTLAVYMMEIFSDTFLFGLRGQQDWAKRTRQAAETLPAALDAAAYNRWRALTFSALMDSPTAKEAVEKAVSGMAEMICITLNAVAELEESEARLSSLRTIVRRAILLAHQVRSQQSQYAFVLPEPGVTFEAASMDDIVDDGEADADRTVKCATFPSLFKTVDDDGSTLEPKKIVFRAKVLCREAEDG